MLKTFDDHLERMRVTAIRTPGNIPLFIEDYERILEALMTGNPKNDETALSAHPSRARGIILARVGHPLQVRTGKCRYDFGSSELPGGV